MLSMLTTRDNVCLSILILMSEAANGVIKYYPNDLNRHDVRYLNELNAEKNLIDRQIDSEEYLFWSVGYCGTHLGIMSKPSERAWVRVDPYDKYNHYQVWFSVTVDDTITVNLIPIEMR